MTRQYPVENSPFDIPFGTSLRISNESILAWSGGSSQSEAIKKGVPEPFMPKEKKK